MWHRKRLILTVIFFMVFSVNLLPVTVTAQPPLVPCGNDAQNDECTICHLQVLAMNFLNWLVFVVVAVAALLFVNAGALYVFSPTNPGNISKAHNLFLSALIGLIIVLSAWLIINMVMSALYDNDTFGEWSTALCDGSSGPDVHQNNNGNEGGSGGSNGGATGGTGQHTNGSTYTDNGARNSLASAGIGVNKTIAQGTSLEGVRRSTIDGVVEMSQAAHTLGYYANANEGVIVTGGTEDGHAGGTYSHGNGYKLDLRSNSGTNAYITDNFTRIGTREGPHGGDIYVGVLPSGTEVTAVRENNHWDVTFIPANER